MLALHHTPKTKDKGGGMKDECGIIFVKVTQPTGKTFNNMSVVGVCVNKEAARLDQSNNLTNRIADFMRLTRNGN